MVASELGAGDHSCVIPNVDKFLRVVLHVRETSPLGLETPLAQLDAERLPAGIARFAEALVIASPGRFDARCSSLAANDVRE